MQTIALDKKQARFGIQVGSECRKIFYYFTQQDGSLGVGNYFQQNATAAIQLKKDDEWEISISKAEQSAKNSSSKRPLSIKAARLSQRTKRESGSQTNQIF